MNDCYIGLGSNVGDSADILHQAINRLQEHPAIACRAVSPLYRTQPIGLQAGAPFLNAAAHLKTTLAPEALLAILQETETQFGRSRTQHWGPRTLDLDLLLYADQIINTPHLTVPHPACWYRRFVLDPLAEIAADVTHPEKHLTILQLQQRLLPRPLSIGLLNHPQYDTRVLADQLMQLNTEIVVHEISQLEELESAKDIAILFWLGAESCSWDDVPRASRFDLSQEGSELESMMHVVVQAALDEPVKLPTS